MHRGACVTFRKHPIDETPPLQAHSNPDRKRPKAKLMQIYRSWYAICIVGIYEQAKGAGLLALDPRRLGPADEAGVVVGHIEREAGARRIEPVFALDGERELGLVAGQAQRKK